jgi:hypothetical protein
MEVETMVISDDGSTTHTTLQNRGPLKQPWALFGQFIEWLGDLLVNYIITEYIYDVYSFIQIISLILVKEISTIVYLFWIGTHGDLICFIWVSVAWRLHFLQFWLLWPFQHRCQAFGNHSFEVPRTKVNFSFDMTNITTSDLFR